MISKFTLEIHILQGFLSGKAFVHERILIKSAFNGIY